MVSRRDDPVRVKRKKTRLYMRKKRYGSRLKPSRLYSGKQTYNQTKAIANRVMANLSESKYQGAREDCIPVVAKPTGTIRPMSYIFVNSGIDLSGHLPEFQTPLNLFTFPKGFSGDNRVGEYMYIKHSFLKIEVQCTPKLADPDEASEWLNYPIRCRLMVVKANRKNNKFNTSPVPESSLFIDTQNGGFGYGETTGSINLLMKQPINRRKWLVYKDTSFTLTPPALLDQVQGENMTYAPGRGKSAYRCNVKLPVYKKTHFSDTNNTPDDIDSQWFIILQCCRESHCFESGSTPLRPSNIKMEILGTTSALDN